MTFIIILWVLYLLIATAILCLAMLGEQVDIEIKHSKKDLVIVALTWPCIFFS